MLKVLIEKGKRNYGLRAGIYVLLLLLGLFPFSGYCFGEEFQPDEHTLFLAHYNTSLNADYSQGSPKVDGMDVGYLTEGNNGYFGGRFSGQGWHRSTQGGGG